MADPISIAHAVQGVVTLGWRVYQAVKAAKLLKADCEELGNFINRTSAQVSGLTMQLMQHNHPMLVENLQALQKTMQDGLELIERCGSAKWLKLTVCAGDYRAEFSRISLALQHNLSAINLGQLEASTTQQEDMQSLLQDLGSAQYKCLDLLQQQAVDLQDMWHEMCAGRREQREVGEELKILLAGIKNGLQLSATEQDTGVLAEIATMKADLADIQGKKEGMETEYMRNVINLIETCHIWSDESREVAAPPAQQSLRSIRCPITCEIMTDPVILAESGHTYERSEIEAWLFKKGGRTDPVTGVLLEQWPPLLIPNHTVRQVIQEYQAEQPGRRHPSSDLYILDQGYLIPGQPTSEQLSPAAQSAPLDPAHIDSQQTGTTANSEYAHQTELASELIAQATAPPPALHAQPTSSPEIALTTNNSTSSRQSHPTTSPGITLGSNTLPAYQTRLTSEQTALASSRATISPAPPASEPTIDPAPINPTQPTTEHSALSAYPAPARLTAPTVFQQIPSSASPAAAGQTQTQPSSDQAALAANVGAGSHKEHSHREGSSTDRGSTYMSELVGMLDSSSTSEQEKSARILCTLATDPDNALRLAQAGAIPKLIQLLDSHSSVVQQYAAETLQNLACNKDIAVAMVNAGAIPKLMHMLDSSNPDVLEQAVSAVRSLAMHEDNHTDVSAAGVIPKLTQLLDNSSAAVQEQAAGALRNLAVNEDNVQSIVQTDAITKLARLLDSARVATQEQAAGALANLALDGNTKTSIAAAGVIPKLTQLLDAGSARVGQQAVVALALRNLAVNEDNKLHITKAGAIPKLIKLLDRLNTDIHEQAVGALLNLAFNDDSRVAMVKAGVVPKLSQLLNSGSAAVRDLASRALRTLAANNVHQVSALAKAGAVPELVQLLDNSSTAVQELAVWALRNSTVKNETRLLAARAGAIPKLIRMLESGNSTAVQENASVVLRNLAVGNDINRTAVAKAGAIPKLIQLLDSSSPGVQEQAIRALSSLADNNTQNKVSILQAGATPKLTDLLCSGSTSVQRSAAVALKILANNDKSLLGKLFTKRSK